MSGESKMHVIVKRLSNLNVLDLIIGDKLVQHKCRSVCNISIDMEFTSFRLQIQAFDIWCKHLVMWVIWIMPIVIQALKYVI